MGECIDLVVVPREAASGAPFPALVAAVRDGLEAAGVLTPAHGGLGAC
jgi:hypothetical protein